MVRRMTLSHPSGNKRRRPSSMEASDLSSASENPSSLWPIDFMCPSMSSRFSAIHIFQCRAVCRDGRSSFSAGSILPSMASAITDSSYCLKGARKSGSIRWILPQSSLSHLKRGILSHSYSPQVCRLMRRHLSRKTNDPVLHTLHKKMLPSGKNILPHPPVI